MISILRIAKSSLLAWFLSLVPILYALFIITYVFKTDYKLNGNSFTIKSHYMSFFPFIQLQYNSTTPCSKTILLENSKNPGKFLLF
jgi:hypothetical protein